ASAGPSARCKGRATARDSSPARATSQSAQTIGSAGAQFDGQSRDRAGAAMVEAARFCQLQVPEWMRTLLLNSQPILLVLEEKIRALTVQLQSAAGPNQPRGLGQMSNVVIDREIGNWHRFNNRRQVGSYTGLCPGEYSSGNTRLQSCV